MNEQTKVELLKIAAQMTETILQDKSGFKLSITQAIKKDEKPEYFAVFDYCLEHLKQAFKR